MNSHTCMYPQICQPLLDDLFISFYTYTAYKHWRFRLHTHKSSFTGSRLTQAAYSNSNVCKHTWTHTHRYAFTHGHTHAEGNRQLHWGSGVETYYMSSRHAELRGILLQLKCLERISFLVAAGLVQCTWTHRLNSTDRIYPTREGLYWIRCNLNTRWAETMDNRGACHGLMTT